MMNLRGLTYIEIKLNRRDLERPANSFYVQITLKSL